MVVFFLVFQYAPYVAIGDAEVALRVEVVRLLLEDLSAYFEVLLKVFPSLREIFLLIAKAPNRLLATLNCARVKVVRRQFENLFPNFERFLETLLACTRSSSSNAKAPKFS